MEGASLTATGHENSERLIPPGREAAGEGRTLRRDGPEGAGYVLFDVLVAFVIFSIGFAGLYGLTESAVKQTQEGKNLIIAANLAQTVMDELTAEGWKNNLAAGDYLPGNPVQGEEENFHWTVTTEWDSVPSLLRVEVKVEWPEAGTIRSLVLRGMFDVY